MKTTPPKASRSALLIVDVQSGFIPAYDDNTLNHLRAEGIEIQRADFLGTQELPVRMADKIIPGINRAIRWARERKIPIIYTKDSHPKHSPLWLESFGLEDLYKEMGSYPKLWMHGLVPAFIVLLSEGGHVTIRPLTHTLSGKPVAHLSPEELEEMEQGLVQGNLPAIQLTVSTETTQLFMDGNGHYMNSTGHVKLMRHHRDHASGVTRLVEYYPSLSDRVTLGRPHCVAGTDGEGWAPGLLPPQQSDIVIRKASIEYLRRKELDAKSAVFGDQKMIVSELMPYLAQMNIENIYIMGVAGESCVFRTAEDLCKIRQGDAEMQMILASQGVKKEFSGINIYLVDDLIAANNQQKYASAKEVLTALGSKVIDLRTMVGMDTNIAHLIRVETRETSHQIQ